ncbi:MAG: hypothetical protein IJH20_03280 [Bacilli bacterium]|nr:hypothetical protein [Bacilli bacterium]
MKEVKIRCNEELIEMIQLMAKRRGISLNKMLIRLLEAGYLKTYAEEVDYGETKSK